MKRPVEVVTACLGVSASDGNLTLLIFSPLELYNSRPGGSPFLAIRTSPEHRETDIVQGGCKTLVNHLVISLGSFTGILNIQPSHTFETYRLDDRAQALIS